jgi:hypothetical protein
VFENRALRRISVPEREEVTGGWRKLHDGELQSLYSSLCFAGVITLRRRECMGHVACMRDEKCVQNVGWKV